MFLNESYYGKTPETLAIEQAFQNMQAVTKEEDTKDGAPMFMELCAAIHAFAHTGVRLDIEDDAICYVIYEKDVDEKVKLARTKHGLRLVEPNKIIIFITRCLIYTNLEFQ